MWGVDQVKESWLSSGRSAVMHRIFHMYCSIRSAPYGVEHSYFPEFKLLSLKLKFLLACHPLAQSVSYWAALLAVHKTSYSGNTSGLAYQIGSSLTSPRKKSSDRCLSCFCTHEPPPRFHHSKAMTWASLAMLTRKLRYEYATNAYNSCGPAACWVSDTPTQHLHLTPDAENTAEATVCLV